MTIDCPWDGLEFGGAAMDTCTCGDRADFEIGEMAGIYAEMDFTLDEWLDQR